MNADSYTAESIEVLNGLDPVKRRPGMYTDTLRPNHLGQEAIDNSVDEAIAGFANQIDVILYEDDSLEVTDNGRGMPIDLHPEEGVSGVEVIMTRLMQTTSAKERVYAQSVTFFSTNEAVLTALKASFTGIFGLHESTKTLEAMKKGVSDSLETLSEVGNKVQEEALKAGYGPTVKAESVKKLVDSVINYQIRSREIIDEMRTLATRNSQEIQEAVEDGKRRLARLAADGNALIL